MGLKAEIKSFLRSKGVKTILTNEGKEVRLGNAKTIELLKVATELGF